MQLTGVTIKECELIQQFHDGDEGAFVWVFKTFQPALVFFANRMLSSQDITEAEEVVQDVFMRFYARKKNFQKISSIKAFLYISTKNRCLQLLEKDAVRQRRFQDYRYMYTDVQDSILDDILYSELIRELSDAIEQLPPQCRAVIKYFLEEGKNAKEIASLLGVSVSTINNQKSKGVALLKKRLSDSTFLFISLFF
ncbi:RNA polymerase sigma factor [Sphingobacterium faecale]|uniref:Sigma-70 family RNA polymerase sigma factor n=1 Tax=Sphingobacterium faecale TaxID=2803775 RepID=A0ABS1R6U3_9SPHI|nr:sigma-70 family RNA polymerase sigma factor [Sphingobacterium faecale]MBL1410432.1 sigma-70 family RNA polymerase sigma factor [Sphingobacterium faecale]